MATSKMFKLIDLVINEQEDKARELLHQIIIDKARAIHEEMMASEEDDEVLGGDEGLDLGKEIEDHKDEIESEEHYGDGTMEDIDLDTAVQDLDSELGDDEEEVDHDEDEMDHDEDEMDHDEDDMDHDEHEVADDDSRLLDLEKELEELQAEFEALKNEVHPEHEDAEHEDHEDADADDDQDVEEGWMTHEDDDDDIDWDDDDMVDEHWDDLDESLDLDTVSINAKKAAEVGSGKFARPEANTKSAVAANAPNMNGAKPVKVGQGKAHTGYALEAAPKSSNAAMKMADADMKADNRRKTSKQDMKSVSKEGDNRALLNKDRSEGFGAPGTKSPLSNAPKK